MFYKYSYMLIGDIQRFLNAKRYAESKKDTIISENNIIETTSRINQENIEATVDDIYSKLLPLLGITEDHIALLGLTDKKMPGSTSGDISIAVDKKTVMKLNGLKDTNEFYKFLIHGIERIGYEFVFSEDTDIISIAWPIISSDNKQDNETVSVDIIASDNLETAGYGMVSAEQTVNEYEEALRSELLYWILKEINYKELKQQASALVADVDDLEAESLIFSVMKGLYRIKQTYFISKGGKRKADKSLITRKLIENNPEITVKLLFGIDAPTDSLSSPEQLWGAMMSPSFPYIKIRKNVIKNTAKAINKAGMESPSYFDEYFQMTLTEGTMFDTPIESPTAIHQMSQTEFVEFLQALKDAGITDSKKFNLSTFNTSEVVEGEAIRIVCYDENIGIEMIDSDTIFDASSIQEESIRETLLYFQNEVGNKLMQIAKKTKSWYKVTGKLFYANDPGIIDDDFGITFIGTKYDSKKVGSIGTLVVFDAKGVDSEGQAYVLRPAIKNQILKSFKKLSNNDFKVYDDSNFTWSGEIELNIDYDTEMMNRIFEEPGVLVTKECEKHFKEIQNAIADAFSREIRKKGSVLGIDGSEVSGIVFEINGKKYGASNFNWDETQEEYWRPQEDFVARVEEFLNLITGSTDREEIYQRLCAPDAKINYELVYKKELPKLLKDIQQLKRAFDKDGSIPRGVKKQQAKFLDGAYKKVMKLRPNLSSLRAFVKPS